MSPELAYGLALLVTIGVAATALPKDRRDAVECSLLLATSWILYNSPWHGWGLKVWSGDFQIYLIENYGINPGRLTNAGAWAAQDTVIAMIMFGTYWRNKRNFVLLIWVILALQVNCYAVYEHLGKSSWPEVQSFLDLTFSASLAVLLFVGGRGHGNLIGRAASWHRIFHVPNSARSTRVEKEAIGHD